MSCKIQPARRSQQCNTVLHGKINTITCDTMQWHAKLCNTITYKAIPCSIIQCHAIQWYNMHFWSQIPNSHLPKNQRYPELPQDMWMLWSHWVEFVWAQKRGLYGCSIKRGLYGCRVKIRFFRAIFGQKTGSCSPPGACSATWATQKRCLFGVWSWW